MPVVVLIYFLPVLNPPIITTEPATDFSIALFNGAVYALIAIGLNVVVGQAACSTWATSASSRSAPTSRRC